MATLIGYSRSSVYFSSPVILSPTNATLTSSSLAVEVSERGISRKGGKKGKNLWCRPVVLKV